MPKISVIVPVYNVEPYIHRCVDSILNQTFTDFEMILVDDGSPDNCGAICDEYAANDKRIVVIHKENGGLSDARNTGIDWALANSDSEWITFIDSDDWVHPRYLELLYYGAKENNSDICICNFKRVTEKESFSEVVERFQIIFDIESYFCEHLEIITAWSKLYQKSLFINIRYPIGKIHEDEFITYKLLFAVDSITVLKNELYFYYQNDSGIMSNWTEKNLSVIEAREKQIEFFKLYHYEKAYKIFIRNYLMLLAGIINEKLPNLDIEKREIYQRLLRKKLRVAIWKYRKVYRCNYNSWIFLTAYPFIEKQLIRIQKKN